MVTIAPEIKQPHTITSNELSRRERVMALRAKIKLISQDDAEIIYNAIIEAREASISRDLPT